MLLIDLGLKTILKLFIIFLLPSVDNMWTSPK